MGDDTNDPLRAPTDERIVDATLAVLAREGIAGVSMRAVAREADVAVGLANYHFDGKTDLISAALRRIGDKDLALVTAPHGLEPDDALRHCLRIAVDPSFLTPAYLSLRLQLWSLAGVDETFAAINQAAQRRYLTALADLIAATRPELGRDEVDRRATDILTEQNGVWLTAILVTDLDAVERALLRCEQVAFA